MSDQQIISVAVIGSGKLGTDIFNHLLNYDFRIVLVCIDEEEAERQNAIFQKKLSRQLKSGLIDEDQAKNFQESISIGNNYDKLAGCDLIIECIWEDKNQKQKLFEDIAPFINDHCILASNSSSLNPSSINQAAEIQNRFIGLHFFYPVRLKSIVEIIKTKDTSQDTLDKITNFCQKIEKTFLLQDESNSFVLNKLFLEVQNEAYNVFCDGLLTYRQIDRIVDENLFPGGIFNFFDQVGNDIMLESIKNYIPLSERGRYSGLIHKLEDLCAENLLGIKTNAGFYDYREFNNAKTPLSIETIDEEYLHEVIQRLTIVYCNKAQNIVDSGICSKELLEFAAKEYMNADKGPFSLFAEFSTNKI